MKEQIEEMFNIIVDGIIDGEDNNGVPTGNTCADIAKFLYNAGYRKQEWISVEDRLPDTDEVLVYCRKGVGHAAPKKQGLDKMDWDVFFNITGTTHWMPLPQPPKMKGGAE